MKLLPTTLFAASALTLAMPALADEVPVYTTEITDHQFTPDVIEVEAGKEFQLVVKNNDKTAEEFESHDLHLEKMVGGGKEITLKVKKLKPGEYKFVGEFNEASAKGKIIAK